MQSEKRTSMRVDVDGGVVTVTLDNGPVNILDFGVLMDLQAVLDAAEADAEIRVLVVASANPAFFSCHGDVEMILLMPETLPDDPAQIPAPGPFTVLFERIRTSRLISIAQLEGRAGGGGSELAMACDLRIGARDGFILNQPEVALGLVPGATGTQRLARLIGRARALEVIASCADVDATTAAEWGYLNRVLPDAEVAGFVDALARRIARWSPAALAAAKACVDDAAALPLADGLDAEWRRFAVLAADPDARARMRAFLDAGGQTPAVESRLGDVL